ncbi:MAG TPA: hypothetical protein VNS57_01135 [Steroidobacteraceae bacterium]|nr:hypothetical protein [Steroidobacteraceae bacterium]
MTAAGILHETLRGARVRRGLDVTLTCLPWLVAAAAVAWRVGGEATAATTLVLGVVATLGLAWHRTRSLDTRWLVRELDAQRPDMDDSADLLFASADSLTSLERLQLARLQQRIESSAMPDLRPGWSSREIGFGMAVAALTIAAVALWPAQSPATASKALPSTTASADAPMQTRLVQQRLRIAPPAYTRLPARDSDALDAKAPQGTQLQWTLRFEPQPSAVELVYHDGRRVALARNGDSEDWTATDTLARSALYRIVLHDAPPLQPAKLHRLDAIVDRPPLLRVVVPERSLSLVQPNQRAWALQFEASDDYGVATGAHLRITLAQGSGENVTFRELTEQVHGSGTATLKRYVRQLDLASLKLAVGDDLIVQLRVADNRAPTPQEAASPSLILRWPPDTGDETAALEGLVKKALPAYFRSQRQIIIDAEGLLKEKRKLDATRYLARSDAIGVDQRLLRLRYGQFLGEEAEGSPRPPPTSDAADEHAHDTAGQADEHAEANAAGGSAHDHEHPPTRAATFGEAGAVLEEYGHTHDIAEAATLLDPETRATLKAALDQMWQSELHLRQGRPDRALPYAHEALKFIKQVQQASRIYLARVGTELPPIDESRRLTGERAGLARRDDVLVAATTPDPALADLWRALGEAPSPQAAPLDVAAVEGWLREHSARLADPLAFAAVMESLRADPECADCRRELRALLWPLLPRPATAVERRDDGGDAGRRYLDALGDERELPGPRGLGGVTGLREVEARPEAGTR